ncbi:MAG: LytTR family DNA-binding domain-containing protein [Aureisphaera sp.]
MSINCLIVDDEPIAQNILKGYINDAPGLVLVGVCDNAMEAVIVLKEQRIDIMFLDIEMPKITGISFLKTLDEAPNVIFTTAYREFALESYDMNAVDYLLKPFSFERFLKAVNKISLKNKKNDSAEYEYFKVDRKNVKLYYKDILYIEGLSNYVIIHTIGSQYVVYHRLMDLEKSLPNNDFVRIHKSFIVSLPNIKAYGSDYVEVGDKQLTIGNTYRDQFFNAI